jgi:hypothetical protein
MTNRHIAFAGAALLLLGLFTPIVTLPVVGSVNLFANGRSMVAIALVATAGLSIWLAHKERTSAIIWPALAAAGILLYSFGRLQYAINQMDESLNDLQGNPFGGLAQAAMSTVQMQWGWVVLAAGAGLLFYAALAGRGDAKLRSALTLPDRLVWAVAAASALALLAAPLLDLLGNPLPASTAPHQKAPPPVETVTQSEAAGPTREEAAYISQHLQIYGLEARYQDSLLDGRVPGVDFKIKNSGSRTLNEVKVRVVFYDASNKPLAEEDYYPVLVSSYSFGNDNTPLRPNYIWQQERGRFYSAKNVPAEWKTGAVTASIVDIEFGPSE